LIGYVVVSLPIGAAGLTWAQLRYSRTYWRVRYD